MLEHYKLFSVFSQSLTPSPIAILSITVQCPLFRCWLLQEKPFNWECAEVSPLDVYCKECCAIPYAMLLVAGVAFWAPGHVVECVRHLPHSQVTSTLLPGLVCCSRKYSQITSGPHSCLVSGQVFLPLFTLLLLSANTFRPGLSLNQFWPCLVWRDFASHKYSRTRYSIIFFGPRYVWYTRYIYRY